MDYTKYLVNTDSEHIKKYKCNQYSKIKERHKNETLFVENTHVKCLTFGCVGNIASIINHLYYFKGNCKNIYIDFTKKEHTGWLNNNPYDKIFNQKLTNDYKLVVCGGVALFDYDTIVLEDIRKQTQSFFNFNEDLIKNVNEISLQKNINENTLGVHIRMNDWNAWHGAQFGYVYYDDYIREIDNFLNKKNINNIFVASDNHETLEKLKKRYGAKLVFADNISREKNEHIVGDENILRKIGMEKLIGDFNFYTPFIDLLLLTKCGYFIGRKFSNFSCTAVFLGKMKFENIINLSTFK